MRHQGDQDGVGPILPCSKCKSPLAWQAYNTPGMTLCPNCGASVHAAVFPALVRGGEDGHAGDPLLADSEASCFNHPAKRAVVACESCGRFLCALCDIELANQHICASCVESGKKKGQIETIAKERTLHDQAALALAILPLLMWPITIVTGPLTVIYVLRHWKTPLSLIPRTRVRFVMAAIIGAIQTAAWISGITLLVIRYVYG